MRFEKHSREKWLLHTLALGGGSRPGRPNARNHWCLISIFAGKLCSPEVFLQPGTEQCRPMLAKLTNTNTNEGKTKQLYSRMLNYEQMLTYTFTATKLVFGWQSTQTSTPDQAASSALCYPAIAARRRPTNTGSIRLDTISTLLV